MSEQDPTGAEFAAALLGKPQPDGDGQAGDNGDNAGKPTNASGSSEPEPVELTEDEAELARRYSLAPEDVKRVRGDTWADQCADAERLSRTVEPRSLRDRALRELEKMQQDGHPNAVELFALGGSDKAAEHRRLVDLIHPAEDKEER